MLAVGQAERGKYGWPQVLIGLQRLLARTGAPVGTPREHPVKQSVGDTGCVRYSIVTGSLR